MFVACIIDQTLAPGQSGRDGAATPPIRQASRRVEPGETPDRMGRNLPENWYLTN